MEKHSGTTEAGDTCTGRERQGQKQEPVRVAIFGGDVYGGLEAKLYAIRGLALPRTRQNQQGEDADESRLGEGVG